MEKTGRGLVYINISISSSENIVNAKNRRFERGCVTLFPIVYSFQNYEDLLKQLYYNIEFDVLNARYPDLVEGIDTEEAFNDLYHDVLGSERIKDIKLHASFIKNFQAVDNQIKNIFVNSFTINFVRLVNYLNNRYKDN